jgi:hypothetical protein
MLFGSDTVMTLFLSTAVIVRVCGGLEGSGVVLVCVKFVTLLALVTLGYFCVGWI